MADLDGDVFAIAPTITAAANGNAPLAAIVTFRTNGALAVKFEIRGNGQRWNYSPKLIPSVEHRYRLLGFRPDGEYSINMILSDLRSDSGEKVAEHQLLYKTPSLPADFPPLEVTYCKASKREPGFLVFNVTRPNDPHWPRIQNYRIILDQDGEVVFFARSRNATPRILNSGKLVSFSRGMLAEFDMFGNVSQRWTTKIARRHFPKSTRVNWSGRFHHGFIELPNENFVVISKDRYPFEDYPSSEEDPTSNLSQAVVVGDQLVEINRSTGEVENSINLINILDPYRVCYGSLKPDPQVLFPNPKLRDWSHANSLAYDERDDSFLVSARNQDVIIKVARASGELIWILGNPSNWREPWSSKLLKPRGALSWQYHQHDVTLTPQFNVMCFDNGNFRASPPDEKLAPGKNYSRAVEFEIDEENLSVRQVWEYGNPELDEPYSARSGTVISLPRTSNVLICYGTYSTDDEGQYCDDAGTNIAAKFVEVTHDAIPEKVFEAYVRDPAREYSYSVYRCIYVDDLYDLAWDHEIQTEVV